MSMRAAWRRVPVSRPKRGRASFTAEMGPGMLLVLGCLHKSLRFNQLMKDRVA
jgi:hypothetical protein